MERFQKRKSNAIKAPHSLQIRITRNRAKESEIILTQGLLKKYPAIECGGRQRKQESTTAPLCEYFEAAVTSLRPGFPAYCVYVPSGMAEPFTRELVRRIRVWGRNMGANLFVCYWNIGAPEFVDLMKKIGWKKRPFLFLTNKCEIDDTSYIVSIDDQELIRNNEELQKLLPQILDLILVEDNVREI